MSATAVLPSRPSLGVNEPVAGCWVALAASVALWWTSIGGIDLRAMDDTGLVSVLPVRTLIAFALLTASFSVALVRGGRRPVLIAHVVALVVMLFGTTSFTGEALRGAVVWRHLGVTDALLRMGQPDPAIDAYFNWPGFFMLLSFVQSFAGEESITLLAQWAPVGFNLMYLAPLVLILRSVTTDRRVMWLSCWVFLLGNWLNQDYLAPQALGLFLYLVLVAIVLRHLGPPESQDRPVARSSAPVLVAVLVYTAIVASHQLTPFVALLAVSALVVTRLCSVRWLPVLMAILAVAWLLFMAVAYLKGHAAALTSQVGSVSGAVGQNVGERVKGTPGHLLVVKVRLLFTAGLWGLAALGGLRLRRNGTLDTRVALLAMAPFPLLIAQPYGGEMLLRVHLFSLPFVAFLAAAALLPAGSQARWSTRSSYLGTPLHVREHTHRGGSPVLACALLLVMAGCLVSRYGNERMDQFTAQEVTAVDRLYDIVPPGGLLVAMSGNLPWRDRGYEQYDYLTTIHLARTTPAPELADALELAMRDRPASAVILSRSQRASIELLGSLPPAVTDEVESHIETSDAFRLAYANGDARIFVLRDPS